MQHYGAIDGRNRNGAKTDPKAAGFTHVRYPSDQRRLADQTPVADLTFASASHKMAAGRLEYYRGKEQGDVPDSPVLSGWKA
jgi:hypothetical protein